MAASPPHTHRLGRYPTTLMSLLGLLIFGFGTAFVNSFYQYLFFRFVVAQAIVGYVISSVSLGNWVSRSNMGWKWIKQLKKDQEADLPGMDRLTSTYGGGNGPQSLVGKK